MIAVADAIRLPLPDQCVDLVLGSPPYCDRRDYEGTCPLRDQRTWAAWMLEVLRECLRVTRSAVVFVMDSPVKARRYQPAIERLSVLAEDAGFISDRPLVWHSNKAPSRQGEYWSHAWEHVRLWKREEQLRHFDAKETATKTIYGTSGGFRQRAVNGKRWQRKREYVPPVLANPRDVIFAKVGGGHMGSAIACENEAPFPESLVEQLMLPLCPEGGLVLDCFSGGGTTAAVCKRFGRRFIATDLRHSQALLTRRRVKAAQVELFA